MYQSANQQHTSILGKGHIYIARRKRMVEELRSKGIYSSAVLSAMETVPRELYMSSTLIELSYNDKAYPIEAGQTISQPSTVAKQTTLLDLKGNEKILEIGTGSGYQASVLHACGTTVYSIERQQVLYNKCTELFTQLNLPIHCKYGDGYEGWMEEAPFDRIIATAGCQEIPETLLLQLKIGGIAILPLPVHNQLRMIRITRQSESEYKQEDFGECSFVPMLKGVQ